MPSSSAAMWLNDFFSGYDRALLSALHSLASAAGGFFTPLMRLVTLLGEKGIIFFLLALVLMCFPRQRSTGVCLFGAVCCGALITNIILKDNIARARPFETVEQFRQWWMFVGSPAEDGFSFPSGHVTAAAAGMCSLSLMKGKKLVVPSVIIVVLMGISRNYLMAHYPSDVLAAMIVGTASGFIAYYITLFIFSYLEKLRDSMPLAELVLNFDIREILPFELPSLEGIKAKLPALPNLPKLPFLPGKAEADENTFEAERPEYSRAGRHSRPAAASAGADETAPRRAAKPAAPSAGRHAKPEPVSTAKSGGKLPKMPSLPGAYKGKHEKR